MSEVEFTEIQKDAVIELINMGIGRAASALADDLGRSSFVCAQC